MTTVGAELSTGNNANYASYFSSTSDKNASLIAYNIYNYSGGGMYLSNSAAVKGCKIYNNAAVRNGGGICMDQGNFTVSNSDTHLSHIFGNQVQLQNTLSDSDDSGHGRGGGIALLCNDADTHLTVTSGVIGGAEFNAEGTLKTYTYTGKDTYYYGGYQVQIPTQANIATRGAGIYVGDDVDNIYHATLDITGGEITGNYASTDEYQVLKINGIIQYSSGSPIQTYKGITGYGGGVYSSGDLNISGSDTVFAYNTAADFGGAVFINSETEYTDSDGKDKCLYGDEHTSLLNINGGVFSNNEAIEYSGGAICSWQSTGLTDMQIKNAVISDNVASMNGYGGGVCVSAQVSGDYYVYSGSATIDNCTITGNVSGQGGGVFVQVCGIATIKNSTLSENIAKQGTYQVYEYTAVNNGYGSAGLEIKTSTLGDGAAIAANRSTNLTISNSYITNNTIVDDDNNGCGAGVFTKAINTVISNTEISGNTGAFNGGGYFQDGSLQKYGDGVANGDAYVTNSDIMNSRILNNEAVHFGGGICTYGLTDINDSAVSYNVATNNAGGGIAAHGGNAVANIKNTNVTYNKATTIASSLTVPASYSDSDSSTGNDTNGLGGGVFASYSATVSVDGGSVSNNSAFRGGAYALIHGANIVSSGTFEDGTLTAGNVTKVNYNHSSHTGGGTYVYKSSFYLRRDADTNVTGLHSNTSGADVTTGAYLADDIYGYGAVAINLPSSANTLTNSSTAYWYDDYIGSDQKHFRYRNTAKDPYQNETYKSTADYVTVTGAPALTLANAFCSIAFRCNVVDVFGDEYDNAEALYSYRITTNQSIPSSATYSIDGGESVPFTSDTVIKLSNGQSVVIGGLNPGTYSLTEITPQIFADTNNSISSAYVKSVSSDDIVMTPTLSEYNGLSVVDSSKSSDKTLNRNDYISVDIKNIVYAIIVILMYYARATINNKPADMESTPREVSVPCVGEDFIKNFSAESTGNGTYNYYDTYSGMITYAGVESGAKGVFDSAIDEYILFNSQSSASSGVSRQLFPGKGTYGSVNGVSEFENHLNQYGKIIEASDEKWVTYYDTLGSEKSEITVESITVDDNNCDKFNSEDIDNVTQVDVWLFNTPKTYTVNAYIPKIDSIMEINDGTGRIYGNQNLLSPSENEVYYNQRFGGARNTDDIQQNEATAHLKAYGLKGYVEGIDLVAPATIGNYKFLYWALDSNGSEIVSSELSYRNRIMNDTELYAIYGPSSTVVDVGVSMTYMDTDYYTEIDALGNTVNKLKLNTVLNPYGLEDKCPDIEMVSSIYVLCKGVTDVSGEAKTVIRDAIQQYFTDNSGSIVNNGSISTDITGYVTKYAAYHVEEYGISDADLAALGQYHVVLTNKNRIYFSMPAKMSAMANSTMLSFGAILYAPDNQSQWLISDNCVEFNFNSTGKVVSSTVSMTDTI